MTVLKHLDRLVRMEQYYREKAPGDDVFGSALMLCAEYCAYHREILESNCGEFLDSEISGSQAAELSHEMLEPRRVEAILHV